MQMALAGALSATGTAPWCKQIGQKPASRLDAQTKTAVPLKRAIIGRDRGGSVVANRRFCYNDLSIFILLWGGGGRGEEP